MKYTRLLARIGRVVAMYEHYESEKCTGCLGTDEKCLDCTVTQGEEEYAKETIEKIKQMVKEVEENGKV